jgi:hypothetical protein
MPLQFVPAPPSVFSTYQHSMLDFMGPHPPQVQVYHLPVSTQGWRNWPPARRSTTSFPLVVASWRLGPMEPGLLAR